MKNNFATLVLIGAVTYDQKSNSAQATKLSLGLYEQMSSKIEQNKKSKMKAHDWDDMLDTPNVFGAGSYSTESPAGYSSSVDEVMAEQDKENALRKKKEAQEAKERDE